MAGALWAQVRQPETVEVANFLIARLGKSTVTAELMHPDELVSGILSQVAAEPEMARLLAGFIYSTEGIPAWIITPCCCSQQGCLGHCNCLFRGPWTDPVDCRSLSSS